MDHSFQPSRPNEGAAPHKYSRWRTHVSRSVLAVLCAGLLLLAAAALAVALIDWNHAKPWINEKTSEVTGRHFEIRGDLDASWVWPQPLDTGWRRWVPGVLVTANQIELGNRREFGTFGTLSPANDRDAPPFLPSLKEAAKADAQTSAKKNAGAKETGDGSDSGANDDQLMARIGKTQATLRLLPLLRKVVHVDRLALEQPDIALARADSGDNNWTFLTHEDEEPPAPTPWSVTVEQLALSEGQIAYADTVQRLAVRALVNDDAALVNGSAQANTIQNSHQKPSDAASVSPYGISIQLSGIYRDAKVEGRGRAGQLLSLRETELRYPVEFNLDAGTTRATVQGTLLNPRKFEGVDMMVSLASDSMSDLYELTGLVLPHTPPFKTSGHLVGSLEPERATWDYENFSGVVGKSDVQGHLTYTSGEPRPKLKGQIKSRELQLADLGPLVGTPEGAGENTKKTTRPGKVLPDTKFATSRWDAMDLDISFLGQKLLGPSALPLDSMSVRAILKDGVLQLDPLLFGIAKGRITAKVELDGHQKPLSGQIRATVDDLQLSSLFPKVELLEKSFGRMDGAFALRARGDSIATLLAKSDGELRVYIRDGTFSKQMLDLAALNVGSVVVSKLFGADEEVKLRCAVADLGIKNGIAQTRSVKLSTDEAVVEAVGTLNFEHEHVDLRIKPESLEWKFLSLRTPLNVRGPFIKPEVSIEAGPLLARAGAAILAAAVAPAALALVPITVPAAEDDEACSKLLARAEETVKAGPAGAVPKP